MENYNDHDNHDNNHENDDNEEKNEENEDHDLDDDINERLENVKVERNYDFIEDTNFSEKPRLNKTGSMNTDYLLSNKSNNESKINF